VEEHDTGWEDLDVLSGLSVENARRRIKHCYYFLKYNAANYLPDMTV
jgi:hypothetical protein